MIEKTVLEFLNKYKLKNSTIIVGFSGGFDSMCLLNALINISRKKTFKNLKIIAAHFNHNWRGKESDKEEIVCKDFANKNNIEFYTEKADKDIKKTENDARIARYNFFEKVCKTYNAKAVLTAHNRDDNAETLLYRIIKGTGIVGLQGISEQRGIYYRPLLKIARKDIEDYCLKNNLLANKDSSNNDTKYNRNFIRLEVLPLLEKINPETKDALNTLSEVAISENSLIEEFLTPIKKRILLKDNKIDSINYKKLSKFVKKRILHQYMQNLDLDYDHKKINDIYTFIENNIDSKNGTTTSLSNELWLYVNKNVIETVTKYAGKNIDLSINDIGEYTFDDTKIKITRYTGNKISKYPSSESKLIYADLSGIEFPMELRTRKEGDIINPYGMQGSMKLKKYFNAKGIKKHARDNILLLAKGDEILWAMGVGISNKIAVQEKPSHKIQLIKKGAEND